MDHNACDICGQPASVHMTEIREGQKTDRHLCAAHFKVGPGQGFAPGQMRTNGVECSPAEEMVVRGIMDQLRGTSNFARQHGRMPASVEELQQGMSMSDDVAGVEITDPQLRAQLKWVDGLLAFCKAHGRMPRTPSEMPTAPSTSG